VEPELPIAERTNRFTINLDVGDEKDLLIVLKDAFRTGA